MVRLKVRRRRQRERDQRNFNSTMVRLKDERPYESPARNEFQFHYGTIKSRLRTRIFTVYLISIPLWYD